MHANKGPAVVFIMVTIMVVVVLGGALLSRFIKNSSKGTGAQTACPQDAKLCPDGTAVGRTGPECEFEACAITDDELPISNEADTSNWKTYRNEEYGYEFQYPSVWGKDDGYPDPSEVSFSHGALFGDVRDTYAQFYVHAREMSKEFIDFWNTSLTDKAGILRNIKGIQALEQKKNSGGFDEVSYAFVHGKFFFGITIRIWDKDRLIGASTIDDRKLSEQILSSFKFTE